MTHDLTAERKQAIKAEWTALTRRPLKELRRWVQQDNRVIDVSDMDKASAVSNLMTAKYGTKAIRETFFG